jgi:hypothetical protein
VIVYVWRSAVRNTAAQGGSESGEGVRLLIHRNLRKSSIITKHLSKDPKEVRE